MPLCHILAAHPGSYLGTFYDYSETMPSYMDREATKKMYNSLTVSLAPLPLLGLKFSIFRRRSRREALPLAPSRPQQRCRRTVEQRPDEVRRVAVRRAVDVVAALAEVEVAAVLVKVKDLDDGHAAL